MQSDTPKQLTKNQRKQLDFLRKEERREAYQSLAILNKIDVSCRTCKVGNTMNCADGARSFVLNHIGHDTWVQRLGNVKATLPPL